MHAIRDKTVHFDFIFAQLAVYWVSVNSSENYDI